MQTTQKHVNNKIKIGGLYKIKNTVLFYHDTEPKNTFRILNYLILVLDINKTECKYIVSTKPNTEFLRDEYTLKILFKDVIGNIRII